MTPKKTAASVNVRGELQRRHVDKKQEKDLKSSASASCRRSPAPWTRFGALGSFSHMMPSGWRKKNIFQTGKRAKLPNFLSFLRCSYGLSVWGQCVFNNKYRLSRRLNCHCVGYVSSACADWFFLRGQRYFKSHFICFFYLAVRKGPIHFVNLFTERIKAVKLSITFTAHF